MGHRWGLVGVKEKKRHAWQRRSSEERATGASSVPRFLSSAIHGADCRAFADIEHKARKKNAERKIQR